MEEILGSQAASVESECIAEVQIATLRSLRKQRCVVVRAVLDAESRRNEIAAGRASRNAPEDMQDPPPSR